MWGDTVAHFAKINSQNVVERVECVSNSHVVDDQGHESENFGIAYLHGVHGEDTRWVQTSYNRNFRKNYAGKGFTWDAQRDAFIPPKPHASWVLDDAACQWRAPVECPADGKPWAWSEERGEWLPVGMP